MKNIYLLIAALFVVNGAMGQTDQPCSTCLPQGITFGTQSQIDNFQANYPGCTEIQGWVRINGLISNLNGLNVITSIGGDLSIYLNSSLTSLTGLNDLSSIGGSLTISQNDSLTSLTALNNLSSIGGGLDIYRNYALTSLTGLENLTSIGDYLFIGGNALTSLTGLEGITSIVGYLHIGYYLYENPALTSLTGLNNLSSIGGGLSIYGNYALISLTGLENLTSIGGSLEIQRNDALTNLSGLDNLTSIGGEVRIGGSYWLGNPAMISLSGLDNLTSIGGDLIISGNDILISLTGLGNIESNTISNLEIEDNSLLSTCAVQSICDYLANPNGTVVIGGNATGCNSQQEIEVACATLGDENLNQEASFSLYPNPTSTNITIETTAKGNISIHNTSGQQLLQQDITEPTITIDVSTLPRGLYVVKVVGEKGVQVGKFIKQ